MTGREEGSHRLSISQLLRRQEAAAATGRRSRRQAARRKGHPQLPPGEALAGWPQSSRPGDRATLPTPPTLLRRRRPHDPTWLRGGRDHGRRARGSAPETRGCGPAGRNHPVRRAAAAPPGPRPLPAAACASRSDGGCGPGAGPAAAGVSSRVLRAGGCRRREGRLVSAAELRTSLVHSDTFARRPCGPGTALASGARPRDVTPQWNPAAGDCGGEGAARRPSPLAVSVGAAGAGASLHFAQTSVPEWRRSQASPRVESEPAAGVTKLTRSGRSPPAPPQGETFVPFKRKLFFKGS